MKNLEQILKKRILNFGPLSMSDFILEANLNSKFGYYNNNFPFGEKKDYITSPEISQMFGELLALWSIACWNLTKQEDYIISLMIIASLSNLLTGYLKTVLNTMLTRLEHLIWHDYSVI